MALRVGLILLTLVCGRNAFADLSTAFLVARIEIEDTIKTIDAGARDGQASLQALKQALSQLENYQAQVFNPAFARIEENRPLSGLMLTRIHSYLKIHLTILERGLALARAFSTKQSNIDENAYGAMALSLLQHERVYLAHDRLRRLLDREDRAYDIKNKGMRHAYELLISDEVKNLLAQAAARRQLNSSLSARFYQSLPQWGRVQAAFRGDWWSHLLTFVVHHISGGIGNTAGSIRFRKGTMWEDQALNESITARLQPMDIITERTPFILTDKFIPGHFGHNAFWIGNEDQLRALGIWDQPYLRPFHQAIRNGHLIFETDRSGTHLKRLPEFMNVDEYAIIRRSDRPKTFAQINEFYAVLFAQYGKTYDFNFDVETTDKLVCSELIYQAFGDVEWPTEPYLGRFTISPDNVASIIVQKNTPFELIYSHERKTNGSNNYKSLIELAGDLGFSHNGFDQSGHIFEKQKQTCMNMVQHDGRIRKACAKSWVRPVYGAKAERRFR